MVLQFWYGRDSAQFGPYSATRMRELAATGEILPSDQVWQDGAERKFQASQVGNLFAKPAVEEPAPPPAQSYAEKAYKAPVSRPAEAPRKKRVIAIKGGVLCGQDGSQAQYRKKCSTCGWEESCRSTANIRVGMTRVTYFCRACRKGRTVEFTSISS